MTTAKPASIVPVVSMTRHRAVNWPAAERAEMARRLEAMGTTINELSDARELAGRPRLSSSSAEQRHYAPLWLLGSTGQDWLAKARAERELWVGLLGTFHPDTVANARHLLGIRRATPSCLRLGELRAICSQARLIQVFAGQ